MRRNIISLLIIALFLVSCSKNKIGVPADLSKLEKVVASGEWAVINTPYAAFREAPFLSSEVCAHVRKGDIYYVYGKSIQKTESGSEIWYEFEKGWISSKDLLIFDNQLKAQETSKKIK